MMSTTHEPLPEGWAAQRAGFSDHTTAAPSRAKVIDVVLDAVCHAFAVSRDELRSSSRKRELQLPRAIASYVLREEGNISFTDIGRTTGVHHTTAMYSVKQVRDVMLRTRPAVAEIVSTIAASVRHVLHPELDPSQLSLFTDADSALATFAAAQQAPSIADNAANEHSLGLHSGRAHVERVMATVAQTFGISTTDLTSPRRTASVVLPRWVAMRLMRDTTSMSLPSIASALGLSDHSSVTYGLRAIDKRIADDPQLATLVGALRQHVTLSPDKIAPLAPALVAEPPVEQKVASRSTRPAAYAQTPHPDYFPRNVRAAVEQAVGPSTGLLNDARRDRAMLKRWLNVYVLSKETSLSTSDIARMVGAADHTSVTYALAALEARMEREPSLRTLAEQLRSDAVAMGDPLRSSLTRTLPGTDVRPVGQSATFDSSGFLDRLSLRRPITAAKIDTPAANSMVRAIKAGVCNAFGLTEDELTRNRRTRASALPRWVAMHLLQKRTSLSLVDIASELGLSDHTTVAHGLAQISQRLRDHSDLRAIVGKIEGTLGMPELSIASPTTTTGVPTPDGIKNRVCHAFGITREELTARRRTQETLIPRWITMHLLHKHTSLPLTAIAAEVGVSDHSTVSHALGKLQEHIQNTPSIAAIVDRLSAAIAAPAETLELQRPTASLKIAL